MTEPNSRLFFNNIKESTIEKIADNVEIMNGVFISFVNNSGKQFSVQVSEIDRFLLDLEKYNNEIANTIRSHELFVGTGTAWAYQEKPYRGLAEKYFPLNIYSTINPLIGSQTNGIYSAINAYICFLVGVKVDNDKFAFDRDTVSMANKLINKLRTSVFTKSNQHLLGPFDSAKTAALEALHYCYNKHKTIFVDNVKADEFKATTVFSGVYLWASQKGLDENKCDPRVFKDKLFEFNGATYFLSDQWTFESTNGRSIKDLNGFLNIFDCEIIREKDTYCLTSNLSKSFQLSDFIACTAKANLKFPSKLPYRFVASLLTKPFVILTGLAGAGKTKLAEAFSFWISSNPEAQIRMVSVGADWTNREPLLGYPNALQTGRYVPPDSRALSLIIDAANNPKLPHFLILDEMNMSHVERYFADFLSAMESTGRQISLHPDTPEWKDADGNWSDGVPAFVELPKNLFIIGTVNIDETTYMFSPKVLDRAQVIEFRVSEDEMEAFLLDPAVVDMNELIGKGAAMGADFVAKAIQKYPPKEDLSDSILPFFKDLQDAGAEFGYRSAVEISCFAAVCTGLAGEAMQPDDVIDAAIMQKLLPRVHGSRNKIEKILRLLGQRCLSDPTKEPFKKEESGTVKYKLSYEKIERMHRRVLADGFTSYAEA